MAGRGEGILAAGRLHPVLAGNMACCAQNNVKAGGRMNNAGMLFAAYIGEVVMKRKPYCGRRFAENPFARK